MPPHGRRRATGSLATLLPALLVLFALVAPTVAISGVLGIDLGTEYIKAALVKPGIPLEIVLTKDSRRKELAALAFKPSSAKASYSSAEALFPERAYGADAQALAARFPGDVYPNLKPLLGLSVSSTKDKEPAVLAAYQARYPGLTLQECSAERDTVCLRSKAFATTEEPFPVEELLAMQLKNVRKNAEDMAGKGNIVTDAVITVPPFWTVDERRAVETAAELAGLRVLALTTDGLAVGIHYATTRTFPLVTSGEKPEYHLVFDMGAGSAKATIMRFQGKSVKDVGKFNKTIQEIQVVGAGWDQTLGGDALNHLLVDDLVKQLSENKAMKDLGAGVDDIHRHGRTMAKFWKEAQRLRQVLSANTETQTSMEALYNGDIYFKYKISRAQFERLAVGYEDRVKSVVRDALKMAKLDLGQLDSVILHGGATRTPLVQKALEAAVKNADLLKTNVNSDEAAAFGAAFRAAGISPSFRVKEIRTSEAAILPIELGLTIDGKTRKQSLFVPESLAGKGKLFTLKTNDEFSLDFTQVVTEAGGAVRHISISKSETTNLTASVKELKEKHGCEAADIQTSLTLRLNSGTNFPEVVEGAVSCVVTNGKKPAGVVDGVKNLFGFGGGKDEQVPLKENEPSSKAEKADASSTASSKKADSTDKDKSDKKAEKEPEVPKEPEEQIKIVHVGIKSEDVGMPQLHGKALENTRDRMKAFDTSDRNRRLREAALNDLESYSYKVRDLVDDARFVEVSTQKVRDDLAKKASAAGEWIYGDGADAKIEEFKARLKELKDIVKPIESRRSEAAQRDTEVTTFLDTLNNTRVMFDGILKENADRKEKSASAEAASSSSAAAAAASPSPSTSSADELDELDDAPAATESAATEPVMFEMPTLSEEAIAELEKSYAETKAWFEDKLKAQKKLKATEDPAFTVAELKKRAAELQQATVDMLTKQMNLSGFGKKAKAKKPKKSTKTKTKTKKNKTSTDDDSATATSPEAESATTTKHDEL